VRQGERARAGGRPKGRAKGRRRWMPLAGAALVCLAAFLLYRTLSRYSLDQIVASVTAIPMWRLASAGAFAAASYFCLTWFDWLALRYVGRPLPYPNVALASFTSLSLGHNIGFAALSSGAIRYRFYSRWGLRPVEIAKVILFCGVTVGLGLAILGGIALLARTDLAAQITGLSRSAAMTLGVICLVLPGAYLVLAARLRRPFRWRHWTLAMPPPRVAIGQLVIGPANFACVAGCLHQALATAGDVPYLAVASVYVIANVTSLVSHVPGGLGVIESVVMYLLPGAELIGALIVFRFVYFLVPLVMGSVLFAVTELTIRRRSAAGETRQWKTALP
jgi:glycosyltransferase 2 family protein